MINSLSAANIAFNMSSSKFAQFPSLLSVFSNSFKLRKKCLLLQIVKKCIIKQLLNSVFDIISTSFKNCLLPWCQDHGQTLVNHSSAMVVHRTSCCPILFVIILLINKSDNCYQLIKTMTKLEKETRHQLHVFNFLRLTAKFFGRFMANGYPH